MASTDRTDDDDLSLDDLAAEHDEAPPSAAQRAAYQGSPLTLIAGLALQQGLSAADRRRLRAGHGLVLLLEVPTSAWCEPLTRAIKTMTGQAAHVITATGERRRSSPDSELDTAKAIMRGDLVVGIAPAPVHLPAVLRAAADRQVVIPPASPALMAQAIATWCAGRRPKDLTPQDLAGLDLPDLAAALRPDSRPRDCVERLRRAARSRTVVPGNDDTPRLQELHGYGAARDWALALVDDVARVRRGELSGDALESAVLFGPPGTGKTTLARAIACNAGITFSATSVADWFAASTGYLDAVIKQANAYFDALLAAAPCIGFLDELDALPNRATLSPRGADWWLPVITNILLRIDQVRAAGNGVILLAATNHIERIDAALLRPGRFDRQFEIAPPDEASLVGILRQHLGADLEAVDLTPAARLGAGATGAVVVGWIRAARRRARAASRPLRMDDLLAAIAPPDPRPPALLRATAIHEAAHAVVALRLGLRVRTVSIRMNGAAGGETTVELDPVPSRSGLEAQITGLLAGRAGDIVLGSGPTAGAASDLREATRLACAIHASFGLGATLLHRSGHEQAETILAYDPQLAARVEADLQRLMGTAVALVEANRDGILALAERLLERRVLAGAEIVALVAETTRKSVGDSVSPGSRDPVDAPSSREDVAL